MNLKRRLVVLERGRGADPYSRLSDDELEEALAATIDRMEEQGCYVPAHWRSATEPDLRRTIEDLEELLRSD